ncbi:MAG: hypothetical protein IJU91_01255 [Selenomonadaceae bacterium]|nr:hypothetical protein [Selenomonadaceae bacterium]
MITELMIVLIAVGAGIIFIVWINSRKRRNNELDQQEIEDSTNKFKQDLENTANEIIGRMQEQASNLENLLDHSERNRTQLEGRVSELKKLLKRSEGQSTEIKDLLARLDDAVDDISVMQQQMDLVEQKINAAINMPMQQMPQMIPPPLMNTMMQSQPALQQAMARQQMPPQPLNPRQSTLVPSIMLKTPQAVKASAPQMPQVPSPEASEEFAKVLAQSMGAGVRPPMPPQPAQSSVHLSQKTNRQVRMVNSPPVQVGATPQPAAQSGSTLSSLERRSRLLAERLSAMKSGNAPATPTPTASVQPTGKPIQTGISTAQSTDVRRAALDAISRATDNRNATKTDSQSENKNPAGTYSPPRKTPQPAAATAQTSAQSQQNETAIIKSMLLAGMTVDEIARETGIGRGAIELVQQIMRLQLGRK